ncbi:MAG: histidine kinase N-terminal 7TM domain-containing protein, partial [Desulfobacterales bacterium]|nr:histidine kinase N-terminal 7TM domain-containing protein [Desulfobacterales bacterium]
MNIQFHPIIIIYFFSCAIALYMAYLSRKMPAVKGSRVWGVVMLFCAIWSAGDGLETVMVDLPQKLFMIRFSYVGVIGTAVFWSFFIVIFSNNDRLLTTRVKTILSIVPIITFVSVMTLHMHPFFYRSVETVMIDGHVGLSMTYGPIFKVWSVFAYCAIFGSGVLLVQSVLRFPQHFHGQIYLLIVAGLMPLVSNFLYITGNNFIDPFDPSAPAFVISGLLVGLNLRRYRFMDLVPVAHELVFEHVNSGVIVIDNRGVVLDMNPAAEKMTELKQKEVIGHPVTETILRHFHLSDTFFDTMDHTDEVTLGGGVFEIQLTSMADAVGREIGRIILLYDITALKKSEARLSVVNEQLKKIAATDPLTELANRRSFFELAGREFSRAKRGQLNFSLILIDLDNFKAINDTKGHSYGDQVLKETARCLKTYSRSGDLLCRYGGDEFIVLAYEANIHESQVLAQRFCQMIPSRLPRSMAWMCLSHSVS